MMTGIKIVGYIILIIGHILINEIIELNFCCE